MNDDDEHEAKGSRDSKANGDNLETLAKELSSFSGGREEAEGLLKRASSLKNVPGKLEDPAQAAVRRAPKIKKLGNIGGLFGVDPNKEPEDPKVLSFLAPFLGHEKDGAASYHNPLKIDDERAIRWASYMAKNRVIPTPMMREFINVLLQVRPRTLWIPAAEALAAFALRGDKESKDRLKELCHKYPFDPAEQRKKNPSRKNREGDEQPKDNESEPVKHLRRHVRYAAACWLGGGGDAALLPEPLRKIAKIPLPGDSTEASIEVLCVAARSRSAAERSDVLLKINDYVANAKPAAVFEEALRHLHAQLSELDPTAQSQAAKEAVEKVLLDPSWLSCRSHATSDLIWSWLQSIELLSKSHEGLQTELIDRHKDMAPLLAFRFAPETVSDSSRELASRLIEIFTKERFASKTRFKRALCVAEAAALLEHPDFVEVNWPAFLSASLGAGLRVPSLEGTADAVGLTQIICWLAALHESDRESSVRDSSDSKPPVSIGREPLRKWFSKGDFEYYAPLQVIRDKPVQERAIIALTAAHHEKAVNQVAVQAERRLRELYGNPAEQIRFLWRLLEVNPLDEVFPELMSDIRGRGTSLHALIKALIEMDKVRESLKKGKAVSNCDHKVCTDRMEGFLPTYEVLVNAAITHLGDGEGTPAHAKGLLFCALRQVIALKEEMQASRDPLAFHLAESVRKAIKGDEKGQGLAHWFAWVDKEAMDQEGLGVQAGVESVDHQEEGKSAEPNQSSSGGKGSANWEDTLVKCGRNLKDAIEAWVKGGEGPIREDLDKAIIEHGKLRKMLEHTPWPEREGLNCALDALEGFLHKEKEQTDKVLHFSKKVQSWVDARDAEHLANAVEGDEKFIFTQLSPALLEAAHKLLLNAGGEKNDKASKGLRYLCLGNTRARLFAHFVEHLMVHRRTEDLLKLAKGKGLEDRLDPQTLSNMNEFLLERLYVWRS